MEHRFPSRPLVLIGCFLCLAAVLGPGTARAGLDVDLGARLRVGDDADIFLSISSRYFDRDYDDVRRWQERCGSDDDLAVILFISRQTGRPPAHVAALRAQMLSWFQVGSHLGMPVSAWYVPVSRDPGPPYGNAYGHWKKHKQDQRHIFLLSDGEVRDLVAVRILHEYFGVEPRVAMEWRASGGALGQLTAREYRQRHDRDGRPQHAGRGDKGKLDDRNDRAKGKDRKVSNAGLGK